MIIAFYCVKVKRCTVSVAHLLCHWRLGVKPEEIVSEPFIKLVMNNTYLFVIIHFFYIETNNSL